MEKRQARCCLKKHSCANYVLKPNWIADCPDGDPCARWGPCTSGASRVINTNFILFLHSLVSAAILLAVKLRNVL